MSASFDYTLLLNFKEKVEPHGSGFQPFEGEMASSAPIKHINITNQKRENGTSKFKVEGTWLAQSEEACNSESRSHEFELHMGCSE